MRFDNDPYDYDQSEFVCSACEDQGLMEDQDGFVVPCCECSVPVTLDDLLQRGIWE